MVRVSNCSFNLFLRIHRGLICGGPHQEVSSYSGWVNREPQKLFQVKRTNALELSVVNPTTVQQSPPPKTQNTVQPWAERLQARSPREQEENLVFWIDGQLHSWAHNSCGWRHKAYRRSSQSTFQHGVGSFLSSHPKWRWSCWQLLAAGGRKSLFFKGVIAGRLTRLQ